MSESSDGEAFFDDVEDDVDVEGEEYQMIIADAEEDRDIMEAVYPDASVRVPASDKVSYEFSNVTRARSMSRLDKIPESILETAYLLHQVPLSRRELGLVADYVDYHVKAALANPEAVEPVPTAAKVQHALNEACDRKQDGSERCATFVVPEQYPDVSVRSIDFFVSRGTLLFCFL